MGGVLMRYRVPLGCAWLLLAACAADKPAPPPPPEVTVAEARAEELAEWDEYQGEFEAIDAVEVRPRVSGYLVRVAFTEGKEVRKGDVSKALNAYEPRAGIRRLLSGKRGLPPARLRVRAS